jgi:hypothetical protein
MQAAPKIRLELLRPERQVVGWLVRRKVAATAALRLYWDRRRAEKMPDPIHDLH